MSKKKKRQKLRISYIFALVMAIIMMASLGLTYAIVYMLMRLNVSVLTGLLTSSTFIALLGIAVGMGISAFLSRTILRPIFNINEATGKVAKGDFTVRLDDKTIAKEINEIAGNFNIMVKELSNTETLRNDFVSNVSHEFKTPLSAIEGYATLLQNDALPKEEQNKYIENILDNTGRLSKLTQNILALSRLENQEIVLQSENYQLDEQIRRVLLGYERLWEEKNLTIDVNLDSLLICGNKSLLAQVWSNLIDNAIKFSHQNGTLTINGSTDGEEITVSVQDNGVGMRDEDVQHAFDKFYQGERSHSVKGNGLGLALVKRIVSLCGGTVILESERGKGTAVTIILKAKLIP